MTKRELIDAFLRGDVDRRQFVNRLTMLGVSGGAAVAYAANLGQSAAASTSQPAAGFVMRAQATDDEEYGGVIELPSVAEGIAIAIAAVEAVMSILQAIDAFVPGDFADGVLDILQTILQQQQEHLDALTSLAEANGATAAVAGVQAFAQPEFASVDEFLAANAAALDQLAGVYAALVPAFDVAEVRQTTMSIASIASRHAAYGRDFSGAEPLPQTFQEPSIPEEMA